MNITLNAFPDNAPGCLLIESDNGKDILVQTDWDLPGIASTFGWSLREVQLPDQDCEHPNTDGTIDCECCGLKASQFIAAAGEWLNDNDGATAEDPGYFDND